MDEQQVPGPLPLVGARAPEGRAEADHPDVERLAELVYCLMKDEIIRARERRGETGRSWR